MHQTSEICSTHSYGVLSHLFSPPRAADRELDAESRSHIIPDHSCQHHHRERKAETAPDISALSRVFPKQRRVQKTNKPIPPGQPEDKNGIPYAKATRRRGVQGARVTRAGTRAHFSPTFAGDRLSRSVVVKSERTTRTSDSGRERRRSEVEDKI